MPLRNFKVQFYERFKLYSCVIAFLLLAGAGQHAHSFHSGGQTERRTFPFSHLTSRRRLIPATTLRTHNAAQLNQKYFSTPVIHTKTKESIGCQRVVVIAFFILLVFFFAVQQGLFPNLTMPKFNVAQFKSYIQFNSICSSILWWKLKRNRFLNPGSGRRKKRTPLLKKRRKKNGKKKCK